MYYKIRPSKLEDNKWVVVVSRHLKDLDNVYLDARTVKYLDKKGYITFWGELSNSQQIDSILFNSRRQAISTLKKYKKVKISDRETIYEKTGDNF